MPVQVTWKHFCLTIDPGPCFDCKHKFFISFGDTKCHLPYLGYTSSKNRLVVENGPFLSVLLHLCQVLTHRQGASLPSFCWLRRITGWLRFAETSWGHLLQFPLLKKDHIEMDAQDHDEMAFEYPQAWIMPVWEIWTMLHHYLQSSPRAIWGRQALLCCPKTYRLFLKRSPVKIPAAVLNTGTLAYARSEAFKSHKYTLFLLSSKKTLNQLGKTAN